MRYQEGDIVFKDWKIVRWIGGGASGAVYEVQKDGLGVPLKAALKVMRVPQDPAITDALYGDGMDEFSVTHYLQGIVEDLTKIPDIIAALLCPIFRFGFSIKLLIYLRHQSGSTQLNRNQT